jgi:hypothetical protein
MINPKENHKENKHQTTQIQNIQQIKKIQVKYVAVV